MLVPELIVAVQELASNGVKLKTIEEDLRMPTNSLSGMLSGSRPFPKKWIPKLERYVAAHQAVEQNNLPANKERILKEREGLQEEITDTAPTTQHPLADEIGRFLSNQTTPPAGLTKSQQIRWHRERSQTLQ